MLLDHISMLSARLVPAVLVVIGQAGSSGQVEVIGGGGPDLLVAADHPVDDALLLRAGRPVPAGLGAARSTERQQERDAALEELRAALAPGSATGTAWRSWLETVLAGEGAPDATWAAAALVAGELHEYDLARLLADALDEPGVSRRRWASRRALYLLYGSWFESRAGWDAWELQMPACEGTFELFDELRARDLTAVQARCRLLGHEPQTALVHLGDPDPAVRGRAAQVLPDAVEAGVVQAGAALDALAGRLVGEVDPGAYHLTLQAAFDVLGAGDVPAASRLAVLRELEAAVAAGRTELALPVARALVRVRWNAPGGEVSADGDSNAADAHFDAGWGVRTLSSALSNLALLGPRADTDVVIDVLGALDTLLAHEVPAVARARDAARLPVLSLVQNPRVSLSVRSAATNAVASLAEPADAQALMRVLSLPTTPADLRYALLGALGGLARGLDPDSALAHEVTDSLLAAVADPEADLRGRALGILADPELAGLLESRDLGGLVDRLRSETVPELRDEVVGFLRAHPRPELLGDVLALVEFDQLVVGEPAQAAELAGLLGAFAAGRPAEVVAAARRLVLVADQPTELVRRQHALGLVAALDGGAVAALDPASHRDVVAWAVELRGAGVPVREAVGEGAAFLRRLVDLHLPGSAGSEGALGEAARAHTVALFLGDLLNGGDAPEVEQEVRDAYAKALALAEAGGEGADRQLVRRDRARFLLARGDGDGALADYLELLYPAGEGAALSPGAQLHATDLRDAAALLAVPGEAGEEVRRARAGQAFDVLRQLVVGPTWSGEPAAVRLQDLEDLLLRATESADEARLRSFEALLEGLPEEPAGEDAAVSVQPASAPRGAAWAGLASAERLAPLRTLLGRARAVREALVGPPAGEPVEKPSSGEEQTGPAGGEDPRDAEGLDPGGASGDNPTQRRGVEQSGSSSGS